MPGRATAPRPLVLVPGPGEDATGRAALVLLEACHELVASHVEGWHEGPGSLVTQRVWLSAVRRLVDDLLSPAAGVDGTVRVAPLTDRAARVAEALYGEGGPAPMPDREPWQGRLLVVLGCGRSGTTWLERMLMASPDAGGVDGAESFLFKVCHHLWQRLPETAAVCDRDALVAALRRFCDTVLAEALAQHSPGAPVFVEKTPLHSLLVPEVAAVYPEAHYLHLVRDGRDVARSMSQVPFFGVPDPADAATLWVTVLREVRAAAPGLRHFREVRYEQLLADPVEGTLDLLAWAGLAHDDALRPEISRRATTRVSTHAGTEQSVGSGTWGALDRRALARVLGACGATLRREGYVGRAELARAAASRAYWSVRGPRLRARVESALGLR